MCPLVLCICNFFIPTVTECVIDGVTYNIGDNVPNDDLCLPWYVALFTGSLNSGPLDYLQGPFAVCFDSHKNVCFYCGIYGIEQSKVHWATVYNFLILPIEHIVTSFTVNLYLLLLKPQVFHLGWIQRQPVIQRLPFVNHTDEAPIRLKQKTVALPSLLYFWRSLVATHK